MSNETGNDILCQSKNKTPLYSRLFNWLFPKYTKWQLLEVYYFNHSWYIVQVRQNVNTGYRKFKCKKFIQWHFGNNNMKNLSVEGIESVLSGS